MNGKFSVTLAKGSLLSKNNNPGRETNTSLYMQIEFTRDFDEWVSCLLYVGLKKRPKGRFFIFGDSDPLMSRFYLIQDQHM